VGVFARGQAGRARLMFAQLGPLCTRGPTHS
jgi:hypothetical protein